MTEDQILAAARKFGLDVLDDSDDFRGSKTALVAFAESLLNNQDAQRYRWLRDKSVPPHIFYISVPCEYESVKFSPSEVDAYIDSAIESC